MDFIFTGTPTKREILLYLKNRKYSLINKIKLKREIIKHSKCITILDRSSIKLRRTILLKNKISKMLYKNLEYKRSCCKKLMRILYYKILVCKYFTKFYKDQDIYICLNSILRYLVGRCHLPETRDDVFFGSYFTMKQDNLCFFKDKKEVLYFDEMSDDKRIKSIDFTEIFLPTKYDLSNDNTTLSAGVFLSQRKNNLKKILELSKNSNKQNKVDIASLSNHNNKIDFTFTKVDKIQKQDCIKQKRKNINVLSEVDRNVKKKFKFKDYNKELVKNTRFNSGYKNIIIRYTDTLITNHIKSSKDRNSKIKFVDDYTETDVHNSQTIVPIIKKTRFQKRTYKSKHKEVVFIQNVDFSTEGNF